MVPTSAGSDAHLVVLTTGGRMNENNDVMEVTIKVEDNPCQVFWQKCRRLGRCTEDALKAGSYFGSSGRK